MGAIILSYRDHRSEVLLGRARAAVQTFEGARRHPRRKVDVVISPESMKRFGHGNSDLPPAAVVRQVLEALGFDEDRLFEYRFDHKLAHYLVARELAVLPMPRSSGLAAFARSAGNAGDLAKALEREFPSGYVIKPCLGAGSGDEQAFDVATTVLASSPEVSDNNTESDLDPYIVQERIPIVREYRVHTVEDQVVEDLILPRYESAPVETEIANRLATFTRECLASMPHALVYDAVCGWDIADTGHGLIVIEINYTGRHPQWSRGFQTSGFLQEPPDGARHLVTWLRWMERAYGVSVSVATGDPGWEDLDWAQEIARLAVDHG
jgi:hypothetical protein